MSINEWVNMLAAFVGMFGILTPFVLSYGKSKSFVGTTNRVKELVNARAELRSILLNQREEYPPSPEYLEQLIHSINRQLLSLERKQRVGLFILFCTIEVGLFFLLTFSRLSGILSQRILGPVNQGGYGFWEGILEPVAFRIALILFLSITSISITLQLRSIVLKIPTKSYYISNALMILLFNIVSMIIFVSVWWALVWIDRLTPWL